MLDSVTRVARAQREVGLAAGEPPARQGYPPSVFALLPRLLERTGTSARGSITALYTVLVAGGDMEEPIADEVRGILDGHVILSREIAARNQWPAVDVLPSLSRLMSAVASPEHRAAAGRLRELLAAYERQRDLILLGAYQSGVRPGHRPGDRPHGRHHRLPAPAHRRGGAVRGNAGSASQARVIDSARTRRGDRHARHRQRLPVLQDPRRTNPRRPSPTATTAPSPSRTSAPRRRCTSWSSRSIITPRSPTPPTPKPRSTAT